MSPLVADPPEQEARIAVAHRVAGLLSGGEIMCGGADVAGCRELASTDFSGPAAPGVVVLRTHKDRPGTPAAGATIDLFVESLSAYIPPPQD